MTGRVHILWPEEVWELWGERETKKKSKWVIESARVAQFTTHQGAVGYLNACKRAPEEEELGLSWSLLVHWNSGRTTPPSNPFESDSLLADWERAFIAKAQVLPVDPMYDNKEDDHDE